MEWYNSKEKLPDNYDDVLIIYSSYTDNGKGCHYGVAWYKSGCEAGWVIKNLIGNYIEVLFWRPLPNPPEDLFKKEEK